MTEKYMTFWEHLAELRSRLKISAAVFFLGALGTYAFTNYLLGLMKEHFLGSYENVILLAQTPMVGFMTRIKFTLILALAITIPFLIYEMFIFVNSALKKSHSILFVRIAFSSLFLFIGGMAFMTFVLLPLMFKFFVSYNAEMGLANFFALDSFFSFVILTIFLGGAVFQLPLVIIFGNSLGIIDKSLLSSIRKWVYLFVLILSGIATPDHSVVSQVALSVVLIVLFEISLIFCKRYDSKQAKESE